MTFLGVSTTCAGLFWAAVFVYLLSFQNVPMRTFLSACFFVTFFACGTFYYARVAIFVDDEGLTYRGILKTHRLGFEEIENLEVLPGLVTVYAIQTPRKALHFTSLFSRHQRLAEMLRDRAQLSKQL